MSDTRRKDPDQYDTLITREEFTKDVLRLAKVACSFCGARHWDHANYDMHNAIVEACSECHDYDHNSRRFVRKEDA
jgi:hypothetical protein